MSGDCLKETLRARKVKCEETSPLNNWIKDGWYVGKLREVPGVFSQGKTLEDLEENIREGYDLMVEEDLAPKRPGIQTNRNQC
jgi:predicted RNase H-like HicB family nuclease